MATSLVPTLAVKSGMTALSFYKAAFNAVELMRVDSPEGLIVAELAIDEARFFIADESPVHGHISPATAGGVTVRIGLFVNDPDAVAGTAVAAGAELLYPVADQSYGYRLGAVKDPYGHIWEIAKKLKS